MNTKTVFVIVFFAIVLYGVITHYNKRKKSKESPVTYPNSDTAPIIKTPTVKTVATPPNKIRVAKYPIHFGSIGKNIKLLQVLVGATPDGNWGLVTNNAVNTILFKTTLSEKEFAYVLIAAMQVYNNKEFDYGSSGPHIKALQVILDMPVSGKFDVALEDKLEQRIGKRTISIKDFEQLASKELSIDLTKYKELYAKEYK